MKKIYRLLILIMMATLIPMHVNAKSESLYNIMKNNSTKDNIASTYVEYSSGIDFTDVSSDINGKGLYMIGSTAGSTYPILYYRGSISNNNALYAGFCWQIIRTTETGGIKLMYAGLPSDGKCNNAADALTIGKTAYNSVNNAPYYGWMYNTGEGDVNVTDSTAKAYLDNWFENNMLDHVKELEDTVWCNDRGMDENSVFNTRTRLEEGHPTLACANKDDAFTVFSDKGNKKLTYPTAIINADELTYAGEVLRKTQLDTFVNISYSYWAMTPYVASKNMYPNSKGVLNMNTFTYSAAIRPMVSVRNNALIMSGTGTNDDPYVIRVTKKYRIHEDEYTTSDVEEAADGETVTLNHTDRSGYKFVSYKITDMDNNELSITVNNNKFEMPANDVKVSSIYRELKEFHNVTTSSDNVNIEVESVEEEQLASFRVNVPHGYRIKNISLKNASGAELDIPIEEKDGKYTFEMPTEDVVIDVELEELNKYPVTGDVENLSDNPYYVGDKVEFKVINKEGFKITRVYLTDSEGNELDIELVNNKGNCSFIMPDSEVKVNVEYEEIKKEEPEKKKETKNPETSDNLIDNIIMLVLSAGGLVITNKYNKRRVF